MDFYRDQPNLKAAIDVAALCRYEDDVKSDHQWRIPNAVLRAARAAIDDRAIARCKTFRALHEYVDATIGVIHGIGVLTVYDVASRIATFRGLEPDCVYLHAGTKKGATALGLGRGKKVLEMDELPAELRQLRPAEVEDCLCIYKSELARVGRQSASRPST